MVVPTLVGVTAERQKHDFIQKDIRLLRTATAR